MSQGENSCKTPLGDVLRVLGSQPATWIQLFWSTSVSLSLTLSPKHKLGKGIKLDSSPRPEFFHTAVVFDTGILKVISNLHSHGVRCSGQDGTSAVPGGTRGAGTSESCLLPFQQMLTHRAGQVTSLHTYPHAGSGGWTKCIFAADWECCKLLQLS